MGEALASNVLSQRDGDSNSTTRGWSLRSMYVLVTMAQFDTDTLGHNNDPPCSSCYSDKFDRVVVRASPHVCVLCSAGMYDRMARSLDSP